MWAKRPAPWSCTYVPLSYLLPRPLFRVRYSRDRGLHWPRHPRNATRQTVPCSRLTAPRPYAFVVTIMVASSRNQLASYRCTASPEPKQLLHVKSRSNVCSFAAHRNARATPMREHMRHAAAATAGVSSPGAQHAASPNISRGVGRMRNKATQCTSGLHACRHGRFCTCCSTLSAPSGCITTRNCRLPRCPLTPRVTGLTQPRRRWFAPTASGLLPRRRPRPP